MVVFLAPLVEELLLRGLLLPRMRAAFGKATGSPTGRCSPSTTCTNRGACRPPCSTASSLRGYPTKRYRSTWMGIITHTLPSFIITGIVLSLVLK